MRAISAKCRSLRRDKRVSGCWIAVQSPTVESDGVFETQVQGIGHKGMPNGNFVQVRETGVQCAQIGQIQVMTRVHQQPTFQRSVVGGLVGRGAIIRLVF
jgi:hypothetical protein